MAAEKEGSNASEHDDLDQYVVILMADSVEEAERYYQLLEDHDIPAIIDQDYEDPISPQAANAGPGVGLLVPECFAGEAHTLIDELEDMKALLDLDEEGDFVEHDDDDEYESLDTKGPDLENIEGDPFEQGQQE